MIISGSFEKPTLRRPTGDRQEPGRWYCESFMIESVEPTSYEEAMSSKDTDKWLIAMKSEMDSIKKKHDKDRDVHVYKAGLVAKGFEEVHDMNYNETRSPVTVLDVE
ncbi:hypothetical protein LIER_41975 [Lithospermum erythrorhizon]|uniref:Uncharacterized protein n=1 Tax=Lithospermum erythrorhizon TaxID=34254 RepID=A0AAV3RIZ0_LITER